jgi:hypothetical protein
VVRGRFWFSAKVPTRYLPDAKTCCDRPANGWTNLRRHVLHRPDQCPVPDSVVSPVAFFAQAEVAQVDVLAASGCAEDRVGRLDVAVDEPRRVRRVDGLCELAHQLDRSLGLEAPAARRSAPRSAPSTWRIAI